MATDHPPAHDLDVVIIGGGPAGLAAALTLGRVRRRVVVGDTGQGRNSSVEATHGYFTRDGIHPDELRRTGREQLESYPDVEFRDVAVEDARRDGDGFVATVSDGEDVRTRRLLLATGLVDELPDLDGLPEVWGRTAFHCTYCDGWETQGKTVAVIGDGDGAISLAMQLIRFTPDLTVYGNGAAVDGTTRQLLASHGIGLRTEPVDGLARDGNQVRGVVLGSGETPSCDVVFVTAPNYQRSELGTRLGCETLEDGSIAVDDLWRTSVPGVYAAGDMARNPSSRLRSGRSVLPPHQVNLLLPRSTKNFW